MAHYRLTPLTPNFGVEVTGIDLDEVTAEQLFPDIRALFEEHSALLFRAQAMTPETHLRLAELFGPLEDRYPEDRKPGEKECRSPRSRTLQEDGTVSGEMDLKTVNLKANFQWHIDSTFLPVPALVNILTAKIVTSTGGATEFASTRAAWAAMPPGTEGARRGARHVAQCQPVAKADIGGNCPSGRCSTNGRRSTGKRSGATR